MMDQTSSRYDRPTVLHNKGYSTVQIMYDVADKMEEAIEDVIPQRRRNMIHVIWRCIRALINLFLSLFRYIFLSCIDNIFIRIILHFVQLISGAKVKFLAHGLKS